MKEAGNTTIREETAINNMLYEESFYNWLLTVAEIDIWVKGSKMNKSSLGDTITAEIQMSKLKAAIEALLTAKTTEARIDEIHRLCAINADIADWPMIHKRLARLTGRTSEVVLPHHDIYGVPCDDPNCTVVRPQNTTTAVTDMATTNSDTNSGPSEPPSGSQLQEDI